MKPKLEFKDLVVVGTIAASLVAFGWNASARFTRLETQVENLTKSVAEMREDLKAFKHNSIPTAMDTLQHEINTIRKEAGLATLNAKYE